ncbi:mitochondrial ornithine transporter 1-like [Oppia nitens]|uniref:mitochondrial ornithine transporter 1-like n=1 Tax=Oppia nitens TaxID=1686743 RepID=UPI0023DC061F|nr:mitochondrial ornithine transporter 1-like [Oppia nitens]
MAGLTGGVANVMVGLPFDTMKVKMQTFPHLYTNTMDCIKQTIKKDSWRGLYAGTGPALAASLSENSVLFGAYGLCQQMVCHLRQTTSCQPIDYAIAGFFAAFFSSFALCPTELIKCKLQALRETGLNTHIGPIQLTRQILQVEGIAGMYRGLTATIAREMPGYFCFFGGYELAKKFLLVNTEPTDVKSLGLLKTTIAGSFGGMCLWSAIFPIDVVKSRIQIGGSGKSFTVLMADIVRREGLTALYKGLTPTLVRTIPSSGALFVAYENTKHLLMKVVDTV